MWEYYNANPLGRKVNDCVVRAISLALDWSWTETYKMLSDYGCRKGITFTEVDFINEYLAERFEKFYPTERVKTVEDFLKLNLKGRWLITMNGHITCVLNGTLYDTFDCSDRYIWNIYKVK